MSVLTPAEAQTRAIAAAGSDDFGPDGWQEGLERTLEAFARLPLLPDVRKAADSKVVHDLTNRLRIEQWYAAHPEIEDQEIEGPVLVCGLPRTGTTATVGMMATDPRFRCLRAWEATAPVPPPIAGEEQNDPRAVAARKASAEYASLQSQHITDPDGPEEDMVMLAPLNMQAYHGAFPMPADYLEWWKQADFAPMYAYERRVLKLLQSRRPPYLWLLKAPVHLFQMDAFAAEFPDARYVWTHRDPAKVIPSVASLQYTLNTQRCEPGTLDKETTGPQFLEFWSEGMDRALAARERIGEDRFVDVWNNDVVASPLETFEALYERLGFEMTPTVRAGVEAYAVRNARGSHGAHKYTAEQYGLTTGSIRESFSEYVSRFDV